MHNAPAVSYPVGRSSMRTFVFLSPWLAGGAVIAFWAMQSGRPAPVHGLALLLWLLVGGLVVHALCQNVSGVLRWDGQQWNWEAGSGRVVGRAFRQLDWQGALLVEFCPLDGRPLWLWPERRMDPLRWDDLRRALQASMAADARPVGGEAQP
jgi:hypothetical protein